ncbi:MAG: lysophospholipid acyltransferase family protein [Myxococcota bacterium]
MTTEEAEDPAKPVPEEAASAGRPARASAEERTPALFSQARDRLSRMERINIALIRFGISFRPFDAFMAWCQRVPGATWVDVCTKKLRTEHGLDRLPELSGLDHFILVSNHRSYFDMFVLTMVLFKHGLRRRILFPVRSNFFYDSPLGTFVNGIMSWFSMYPPIFRERKKLALNHTAMSELCWLITNRKVGAGIHPEGTRNKTDDPYALLPAQSGVGRLIHQSTAPVIPMFINGLINNFPRQILSNFDGTGRDIHIVFGAPIDFGALRSGPATAKTYKALAERTMEVIAELGQQEKAHRAEQDAAKAAQLAGK